MRPRPSERWILFQNKQTEKTTTTKAVKTTGGRRKGEGHQRSNTPHSWLTSGFHDHMGAHVHTYRHTKTHKKKKIEPRPKEEYMP